MHYTYRDIIKIKFKHKNPQRYLDNTYEGIVWNDFDQTPNPTKEELDLAIENQLLINANITNGSFIKSIKIPVTAGTSQIVNSETSPSISEGTELISVRFEATSTLSKLLVTGSLIINSSVSNRNITLALFKNNVCIGVTSINFISQGKFQVLSFNFTDLDLGLSYGQVAPVYSLRIGADSNTMWSVNKSSSTLFGGLMSNNSITFLGFN